MSAVEWVDPPARRAGMGTLFTPEVIAALKSRPGEWACIRRSASTASGASTYVKRNPQFEARSVTVSRDPLRHDLYARYVWGQP